MLKIKFIKAPKDVNLQEVKGNSQYTYFLGSNWTQAGGSRSHLYVTKTGEDNWVEMTHPESTTEYSNMVVTDTMLYIVGGMGLTNQGTRPVNTVWSTPTGIPDKMEIGEPGVWGRAYDFPIEACQGETFVHRNVAYKIPGFVGESKDYDNSLYTANVSLSGHMLEWSKRTNNSGGLKFHRPAIIGDNLYCFGGILKDRVTTKVHVVSLNKTTRLPKGKDIAQVAGNNPRGFRVNKTVACSGRVVVTGFFDGEYDNFGAYEVTEVEGKLKWNKIVAIKGPICDFIDPVLIGDTLYLCQENN